MTAIRSMLFDLDGTLVDTAPDFSVVLHTMCRQMGRPAPDEASIHQTVSSGARALVKLISDLEESDEEFRLLHQQLLALYGDQIQSTHATLYPGMSELLDTLDNRGIAWGVVTNKPLAYSEVIMHRLGLKQRCQVLICPEHVSRTKPDPEPVAMACKAVQCAPASSVYVGDHPRDIDSGRAAGTVTIAAAYGYQPAAPPISEWGADLIAHSVQEISQWLAERMTKTSA